MIKAIEIENFKSFKNNELIEFKDLTLFSGVNGSGKSSIAQIISLIAQSANFAMKNGPVEYPYLQLNMYEIKLGNSNEILSDIAKPLHIGFYFDDKTYISYDFLLEQGIDDDENQSYDRQYLNLIGFTIDRPDFPDDDGFSLEAKRIDGIWKIKGYYSFNFYDDVFADFIYKYMQEKFGNDIFSPRVEFEYTKDVTFISLAPCIFSINITDITNCIKESEREKIDFSDLEAQAKIKKIDLPEDVELYFIERRRLENYLFEIIRTQYIAPFRGKALRIYSNENINPLMIAKRNRTKKIQYDYNFSTKRTLSASYQKAFSYWVKKLELADFVEINEIIDDSVSETWLYKDNKRISIINDGFGISQVLPLIARCLLFDDRLIIVDEPEVHLHPGLQAKIGEFLFIMSKLGKRIIIETHSECIINQIKYLTLCHEEMKENVISYWIEKGTDSSKVRTIEYDEYGFVENPPEGFFDETEKILKKIRELRQKKFYGTENLK